MSESIPLPSQLSRFPAEVQDAYRRFMATGDSDAAHAIVQAALADFVPKNKAELVTANCSPSARLKEDLGYDSLAIAELVFFFEDLFKVTISTEEIRNIGTIGELDAFVTRTLASQHRPA